MTKNGTSPPLWKIGTDQLVPKDNKNPTNAACFKLNPCFLTTDHPAKPTKTTPPRTISDWTVDGKSEINLKTTIIAVIMDIVANNLHEAAMCSFKVLPTTFNSSS